MTTCASPSAQDCRTAVALNNAGVSLLERGCIRPAMKNFKDGAGLMKCSPHVQRLASLRRSSQCLAESSSSCASATQITFELTSLSLDESPEAAASAAIHDIQSSDSGVAIRLSWDNDDEEQHSTQVQFVVTMIHNYAVACRMHATASKESKTMTGKLQTLAYKASTSVNRIVLFHMRKKTARSSSRMEEERNLLVIWMLTLQQLMHLSNWFNDTEQARQRYGEFCFLRAQLVDAQAEMPVFERRVAASAA